jgi:hypothetical protein
MSIQINVNGKMLDMKEVISGGRYTSESRYFDVLTGAGVPYGDAAQTDWSKPEKDFGITIRGQDLRHWYVAPHRDFTSTTNSGIPANVNALKVICIGGGGGGGGGSSAHDNDGNGGTAGGGGGGGGTVAGYIPVEGANNFYVEVGGGGSGSNRHYTWNHGRFGAEGTTPGGITYVQIYNSQVGAGGGAQGMDHRPTGRLHGEGGPPGGGWSNGNARVEYIFGGNYVAQYSFTSTQNGGSANQGDGRIPKLGDGSYGTGGKGGTIGGNNHIDPVNSYGKKGTQGMCRVYFLY